MSCMTDCVLAFGFVGASIFVMLKDKSYKNELYSKLSDEKKKKYNSIRKERMMIWIKASLLAAFISVSFTKFGDKLFPEKAFNKSCINTLIFFGVQYLAYMLHPKSDWMLNYVEDNEQAKLWLKKYKYMQGRWHMGMLLGIVGYFFLSMVVFKKQQQQRIVFMNNLI